MPTLDWLNRDAAFRTAAQVPTRVLRPHRAAPAAVGAAVGDDADASGNLLIQGDNLDALAALLPFYRGRVFVAEYKGEHLRAVPKEIEKRQVGAVWAEHSAGRAVFAMVYKQERGMTMAQQIEAALG